MMTLTSKRKEDAEHDHHQRDGLRDAHFAGAAGRGEAFGGRDFENGIDPHSCLLYTSAASLVEKFEGPGLQTYVLTKDHDYFEVVSEYTRMWRVVNKDKLEQLKETYGLFGNDVYESLPANVFEYTPEIVYAEERCV